MPILMIALLALAVFGAIGLMLTAAVVLETKTANEQAAKTSIGRRAVVRGRYSAAGLSALSV